jgi:hypothetical protein
MPDPCHSQAVVKQLSVCIDVQAAHALFCSSSAMPKETPCPSLDCLVVVAHRYSARNALPKISHPRQTERKTRCETIDMRTNQVQMLT